MYKITAPAEGFNGLVGGVEFKDSVAATDNEQALGYFRRAGYTVDELDGGSPDDGERTLKGTALDEALDAAGLSKAGTADEKRARLVE